MRCKDSVYTNIGTTGVRSTDFEVAQGTPEVHALRISTHLFHNADDVAGLVDAMADLLARMS